MHRFFIKTPWWARMLFPSYVWRIPAKEKVVYLTFDDGPHPAITPWVLEQLEKYGAKATFFCIGANVERFPETYRLLQSYGHEIGNHTFHHLNGWKTSRTTYLTDIAEAALHIRTDLFRPPYGKITRAQARGVANAMQTESVKIIMWDVLSADFDNTLAPEKCVKNVLTNVRSGSIIVFHDSEKAFPNLKIALPQIVKHLRQEGYAFEKISMGKG